MMRRIARMLHRRQDGLTMVELLVAMSVAVIILGAVGGFFVATLKASKTDGISETGTRQSSNVMDALTQYIHAATVLPVSGGGYQAAITYATATEVRFYAYVNLSNGTAAQPVLVDFSRDPSTGLVIEKQWANTGQTNGFYQFPNVSGPAAGSSIAATQTITLGGPIASPTSDNQPLFTYLDGSGTSIAAPNASTFSTIGAIQVNLEIGSAVAGTAGDTHIQNTLYLFNVGYSTSTASPSS